MNDCRCPHLTDTKPYDPQGVVIEVGEGQLLMLCRFCFQHVKAKVLDDLVALSLKDVARNMEKALTEAVKHAQR